MKKCLIALVAMVMVSCSSTNEIFNIQNFLGGTESQIASIAGLATSNSTQINDIIGKLTKNPSMLNQYKNMIPGLKDNNDKVTNMVTEQLGKMKEVNTAQELAKFDGETQNKFKDLFGQLTSIKKESLMTNNKLLQAFPTILGK